MEGQVGIIFMRGDDLWIDSTPITDAVDYGLLKTHEKGHPDFWEELQNRGSVPRDEEYDEIPRGRVNFQTRKKVYYLFLDRCIRERPEMVSRIFEALHLPPVPATKVDGDSHYVCPGCRPKHRTVEGEDADW
jgi:hypothetical protein